MTTETTNTPTPPVGVIESLSQGFELTAGHVALLLVPLVLELLLWVGPRISFASAIEDFDALYEEFRTSVETTDPESVEEWDSYVEIVRDGLGVTEPQYLPIGGIPNIFAGLLKEVISTLEPRLSSALLVQPFPMVAVPSTFASRQAGPTPFGYEPPVWRVSTMAGMGGAALLLQFIGVLIGTLYMLLIAQQVSKQKLGIAEMLTRLPLIVVQVIILNILLSIGLIILQVPFLLLAAILGLINGVLSGITLITGLVLVLWVSLFTVFAVHGMFLNKRNLIGALWDSVRVVQWNLSPTMVLMLIIVVVDLALSYLWTLAEPASWIGLIAAVGHAFVTTGLIASTFIFYQDRYRYWREVRAALLAELHRRRTQQS